MRCYSSIGLLKIEPGHFPEGELGCRPLTLGQEQGHEQVQVGGGGMKTMGHQPDCLCAAAPLYTRPLFKSATLFCFFLFMCTGWSSKTSFIQARASSSCRSLLKASWTADLRSDIRRFLLYRLILASRCDVE